MPTVKSDQKVKRTLRTVWSNGSRREIEEEVASLYGFLGKLLQDIKNKAPEGEDLLDYLTEHLDELLPEN